jgi:regulator of sigma E protease
MQLLTQWLGPFGGLIPFVLLFGVVIGIHELGHYLVARWCGIRAETFSIGVGPQIAAFVDRNGTRWRVACLPLGGYVRFASEPHAEPAPGSAEEPKETAKDALERSPIWQRSLVVAAGPIANFLLAVVVFAVVFMVFGKRVDALRIDTIVPGSAVAAAGIKPGDIVAAIDGKPVDSRPHFDTLIGAADGKPLTLRIERGGSPLEVALGPWSTAQTLNGLGIVKTTTVRNASLQRLGPATAVASSIYETSTLSVIFVRETAVALWRLLPGTGGNSGLGGPVALVQSAGQAASAGLHTFLFFTAVFSIAVGAFNLLPIPPLDGGRLMLYALEAVLARTPGRGPQIARMAANGLMIAGVLIVIYIFATLITGDVLALARKAWA